MSTVFDPLEILNVLKRFVSSDEQAVALHQPTFGGNELKYVSDCIETGWVSSVGKYVDQFEERLAEYTGARRAIAVVNGTAALHMCLKLVGVEPGDEVLIPALTFVATANAVLYCNAHPHFVDSTEDTLGLDPIKLDSYLRSIAELRNGQCYNKETGRRLKAVVPMHTFGHPVDMDPLVELCRVYKLELVEDAAESLGSYYKGRHTGNFGRVAALSFNGNKVVTTGGGGAILTNDIELADLAKHITRTAKQPHSWNYSHDQLGYNYRLPNLNAALGLAQLEQLDGFLQQKRKLADWYREMFSVVSGVAFFSEPEFAKSNYWLNVILLEKQFASRRDEVLEITNQHGIMTRPAWTLLNKLPMYQNFPKMDLSTAQSIESRLIDLPSSARLEVFLP